MYVWRPGETLNTFLCTEHSITGIQFHNIKINRKVLTKTFQFSFKISWRCLLDWVWSLKYKLGPARLFRLERLNFATAILRGAASRKLLMREINNNIVFQEKRKSWQFIRTALVSLIFNSDPGQWGDCRVVSRKYLITITGRLKWISSTFCFSVLRVFITRRQDQQLQDSLDEG